MGLKRVLSGFLAFSCAFGGLIAAAHADALHTDGKYIRDAQNGVLVLRGLNVAGDSKVPNFMPVDDAKQLASFPDWGVNVARLLFTWEAYEPAPGKYDDKYLSYYVGVLDALHALNVRVIVDFHQDAYSRFTLDGCGEGFPEWAVVPSVTKDTPANDSSCQQWGIKMAVQNVTGGNAVQAFNALYANQAPADGKQGVRDSFLAMIGSVAARVGSHPAIIGYDIVNEPIGDEVTQLAALYTDGAKALRAHDADALMFISPQAFTSSGSDSKLPKMAFDNYVYSPHYYDQNIFLNHAWDGTAPTKPVAQMADRAAGWSVPVFIGEFGIPVGTNMGLGYLDAFYAELDARLIGATQWTFAVHWDAVKKDGWNVEDFSIVDDKHIVRDNFRVRPYIARIPGTPGATTLKANPYDITLEWMHDTKAGALLVFAPKKSVFPANAFVEVEGDVACGYESDERHIHCEAASDGMKKVHIRPCKDGETCVKTASTPVMADGGTPGSDSGAPPPWTPDAGMPSGDGDGMQPTKPTGKKSGGCSVAHERGEPMWWLAWLGLSLSFVRRRRA
jgi:endoglycosylceramidase